MTQTANKYGTVLWELGIPSESIDASLELIEQEPLLAETLANPSIYMEEKKAVIERIFPKEMVNFFKILCEEGDFGYFPEIVQAYEAVKNQACHTVAATLIYVTAPSQEQQEGMVQFLKDHFHADDVVLTMFRDTSLIGGFILQAQGQEWDWSMRQRIRSMKQKLSGGDVT